MTQEDITVPEDLPRHLHGVYISLAKMSREINNIYEEYANKFYPIDYNSGMGNITHPAHENFKKSYRKYIEGFMEKGINPKSLPDIFRNPNIMLTQMLDSYGNFDSEKCEYIVKKIKE